MSVLSRYFRPAPPPLADLWAAIVATARAEHWYLRPDGPDTAPDSGAPDTVDGRFDMVAMVTALVMLRLDDLGALDDTARLTERFVADMDGSLRQMGVGDMAIGKQMGKLIGGLGGRIDGYRAALRPAPDRAKLSAALARNIWRGAAPDGAADAMADAVLVLAAGIDARTLAELRAGQLA
jgi:cytochrome b pre-mRNA-processing protein 3